MAYNVRNINVLDLRPSTGVGVAIPFDQPAVFKTIYTTKEQTKYNLINFLLTDPRDRIFVPNFGAGIRARLFEQITTESNDKLEQSIRSSIEVYFPNVIIEVLRVTSDPDQNTISIQFSYRLRSNNEQDQITLNVQNG